MAAIERYIVDSAGRPVEVILPIAEYKRLLEAAGQMDPDAGHSLKPGVMEELLQMQSDYEAGRLETKPWAEVKRELGLTDV